MIDLSRMKHSVFGHPIYVYEDLRAEGGQMTARKMLIRIPRRDRHAKR